MSDESLESLIANWKNSVVPEIQKGLGTVVSLACKEGKNAARAAAPVKTGALRRSITGHKTSQSSNEAHGEIEATADYAAPVAFGSRPHRIEPRNGKALRFQSGGRTVFAKGVNHPGNKPNDFMAPAEPVAADAGEKTAEAIVDGALSRL